MATAKVKIIARLRPKLPGEQSDDAVRVCHSEQTSALVEASNNTLGGANVSGSSNRSGAGGGSFTGISVPNPRDVSQIFRFPYVSTASSLKWTHEVFAASLAPMTPMRLKNPSLTTMCVL